MRQLTVKTVYDPEEKERIVRHILEALPDWFEVTEAREHYIAESRGFICFVSFDETEPVGFLCLKETGAETVELAVMGVL